MFVWIILSSFFKVLPFFFHTEFYLLVYIYSIYYERSSVEIYVCIPTNIPFIIFKIAKWIFSRLLILRKDPAQIYVK